MRPGRYALRPHASGGGRLTGVLVIMPGAYHGRSLTRTRSSGHDHRMPVPLFAYKARAVSVRAFACSGYAADNLVDAVHLRASW